MNILVTGNYNPIYNRTSVLLHGLRKLGHQVIEKPFRKKRITAADKKEIREWENKTDIVFMPSFTHVNVRSVKKITTKPLVFDPLISRYLSKVFDYKAVWKYSPRAYKNYLKDKISMTHADLVFADTQAHKAYFTSRIGIPAEKIHVLPVGVNEELFYPLPGQKKENTFVVGFYGSFIPLHGADVIVETAALLKNEKNIRFVLLGDGVQFNQIKATLKKNSMQNVDLKGWISYQDLNSEINAFDVSLGIFGSSLKTNKVVPNKIYHYMACNKPVITKDTEAMRELFTDGKDVLLTRANPKQVAEKILFLRENPEIRERIKLAGYNNVVKNHNSKSVGNKFIQAVTSL